MAEPIGEHNIREWLTAFADGELDAAQSLTVLDYLAEHPEGLELMRTQQRLRLEAERTLREQTPPVPEDLRRRIEGMAAAAVSPAPAPAEAAAARPWWGRIRWRLPVVVAAAAVFLVAGIFIGRWGLSPRPQPPVAAKPPEPVVPVSFVAYALRVHADCSRLQEGVHTGGYPKEMGDLAAAVRKDVRGDKPYPDLSPIGYMFVGAGPCEEPLEDTIHLLYRLARPGHPRTVSVFVQPYKGQLDLRPDKLYLVSGPRSPFPMFAWRTDAVVYYLLADDAGTAEKARDLIAGAPKPPAVEG